MAKSTDMLLKVKELARKERKLYYPLWDADTTVFPRSGTAMTSSNKDNEFVVILRNTFPQIAEAYIALSEEVERSESMYVSQTVGMDLLRAENEELKEENETLRKELNE